MPDGEFSVIVADPPWRPSFGKSCSRSVTRHYETMATDDIGHLKVPSAPNSLLFLWATAPMLQQALLVMSEWGFRYRTSMVWCKDRPGTGKWVRGQHELILIGRRGTFPAPDVRIASPDRKVLPPSVIHAKRGRHSQKPEELQEIIEATYPGLRYLELFARRQRPGWTVWGNEV